MAEAFATVRVAQGALRGRRAAAEGGGSFFCFQGIPYARAPVGPLRFQVAQPPDPWDGVRDALKEGASCPQIDWIMKLGYRGDEDSLFVNVYTPKLPSKNEKVRYPVMVWIHGGGLEVGSGDSDMYGPQYLVNEDVLVVTFNYRLGVLGFMNVGDIPYNLGLKDQVTLLRWVKENIAVFGGNPNNVTIFGESAGGASVHFHMLSPMSKGLFHKAIMQSGTGNNPMLLKENSEALAFELAKELGFNANNVQELIAFLTTASARDLVEKYEEIKGKQQGMLKAGFQPAPEKNAKPGEEVLLPAEPWTMMEKQQFHSVPVMIGLTSQEGIIALEFTGISKNPENLKMIAEHLEAYTPPDIRPKSNPKEISEKIKNFYFGKGPIDEKSITAITAIVDISTDTMISRYIDITTKYLSKGPSPLFYYHFDFSGKLNFYKHSVNASELSGAAHMDDLGYLFGVPAFKLPEVEPESREGITRTRMVKLWTNFAKAGNPTPELDPAIGVKWPRYTEKTCEYLNISDALSVKRNLNKERMDFWNNL